MTVMETKTILAFNLSGERLSKLRFCCMKLGMRVQAVPPEKFGQTLAALCGLAEETATMEPVEATISGEMVYFAFRDLTAVNRVLTTMKQLRMPPFRLKGVMTDTNLTWTPVQLYQELMQEHQALQQGQVRHEATQEDK